MINKIEEEQDLDEGLKREIRELMNKFENVVFKEEISFRDRNQW